MLRGPQTSAELRANCDRLHRFADISSVEAFLDELAARPTEKGGALVVKLPRAPGAREARWAQLLVRPGRRVRAAGRAGHGRLRRHGELAALKAQQAALRAEVDELRGLVERLYAELGRRRRAERRMRFELPEAKKLTHEIVIPIRWGDMDAMGHVNNTVYFRYFEIVRIDWFERIGCTPDPSGEGPVIVNAFCNFIRQLEFPGDVLAQPLRRQRRAARASRPT